MTVCVLSDSVRYLDKAKDIKPKDVTVLSGQNGIQQDGKDKGEGTAMLEIIHSIAPGAELMFATSGSNPRQMVDNIRAFGREGCNIIVDDKEFYNQSPFQDDDVSKAVDEVTDHGILYITSAGNRGNTKADTSAAWEGWFSAGSVLKDSRERSIRIMHVFAVGKKGEYNEVLGGCGRDGGRVHVWLFWNDPILQPGGNRQNEYELWALNANGVLKDEEGNYVTTAHLQDEKGNDTATACLKDKEEKGKCANDMTERAPGEKPCRHICFPLSNTIGSEHRPSIVITKVAGDGKQYLHLDISGGCRLEHATGGVISGHHGAERALSIAAKSAQGLDSALDPYGVFVGGQTENVNVSSAEGPRRMFFAQDGSSHPVILQKPDVTAADGVTVDVQGFEKGFFGTSAAAPQVAGIAALLWSKEPSLTPKQIKDVLLISATPIGGTTGWNPLSGYGIVNAVRALRAIETVKSGGGREFSSRADDLQRPRRVASESLVARRRLAPLK